MISHYNLSFFVAALPLFQDTEQKRWFDFFGLSFERERATRSFPFNILERTVFSKLAERPLVQSIQ